MPDLVEGYRQLARVNRIFRFAEPFERLLPRALGEAACRRLTLLDLGAGDGSLGRELTAWAKTRGWDWQFTNLDINPTALELNPQGNNVVGSAVELPFPDNHFDVVIAAQMSHHLPSERDVSRHFREAHRVCRRMTLIYDLHRTLPMYVMVWATLMALRCPRHFREDGLLSVRKGWRVGEWQALAQEAGLPQARVWSDHHARIVLQALKPGP